MDFDPVAFYGNTLQFAAVLALAAIVELRPIVGTLRADPEWSTKVITTANVSFVGLTLFYTIVVSIYGLRVDIPDWQPSAVTGCLVASSAAIILTPFTIMVRQLWTRPAKRRKR